MYLNNDTVEAVRALLIDTTAMDHPSVMALPTFQQQEAVLVETRQLSPELLREAHLAARNREMAARLMADASDELTQMKTRAANAARKLRAEQLATLKVGTVWAPLEMPPELGGWSALEPDDRIEVLVAAREAYCRPGGVVRVEDDGFEWKVQVSADSYAELLDVAERYVRAMCTPLTADYEKGSRIRLSIEDTERVVEF